MAEQTPWLYERTWPEVRAYLEHDDVILLPVGSTEQHGLHLPLMTDAAEAIAVARGAGTKAGVLVAPPVQDYAVRLVLATHPQGEFAAADTNRYIRCGASPRGAQALVLAGKVRALLEGRYNVSFEDIRKVYLPALRHRILLNFEAQAENITSDALLSEIMDVVKEKAPEVAIRSAS